MILEVCLAYVFAIWIRPKTFPNYLCQSFTLEQNFRPQCDVLHYANDGKMSLRKSSVVSKSRNSLFPSRQGQS